MHATQLAEIGSWVAAHSGNLIFGQQEQPLLAATEYWTASKIRLQRWTTALRMFEQDMAEFKQANINDPVSQTDTPELTDKTPHLSSVHDPWPALEIVVQEILVSELLTRIWSATVTTHDWYHQSDELHGLAHSVHICHIEARNRALRILLAGQGTNEAAFDRLNGLRRHMERWTDLFLGQLPRGEQASVFGFDRKRVLDFNQEQRENLGDQFGVRQKILLSSFAADLRRNGICHAANPELNGKIASGILACFPSDRFDSHGLPKSAGLIWMEKSQHDTQKLVDHLTEFENMADGLQS